jgi:hypothetical protein
MFGFFTNLVTSIFSSSGQSLASTLFGNKAKRDEFYSSENIAGLNEYSSEFRNVTNRNIWDSFIDGINRLMRPCSFFTFLGLIWFAMYDPTRFVAIASSLVVIPQNIWVIFGLMVGFLFPSRLLEKGTLSTISKGLTKKEVDNMVAVSQQISSLREKYENIPTRHVPNDSVNLWLKSKG